MNMIAGGKHTLIPPVGRVEESPSKMRSLRASAHTGVAIPWIERKPIDDRPRTVRIAGRDCHVASLLAMTGYFVGDGTRNVPGAKHKRLPLSGELAKILIFD